MANFNEQAEYFLRDIEQRRDRQCQEILQDAERQARDLLHNAFQEARKRVAKVVDDERAQLNRSCHSAAARLATVRRQRTYQEQQQRLALAVDQLRQRLLACWGRPLTQARWLENLERLALARLPKGQWQIHHPQDWSDAQRQRVSKRPQSIGVEISWVPDPKVSGGLLIRCDGIMLDSTVEGLCGQTERLTGRLLTLVDSRVNGHLTGGTP